MRSDKPSVSVRLTLVPGGDGVGGSGVVYAISGWQRADGITSHRTQLAQLSGLLSELERRVEILESRFLEVLDTSLIDTIRLAERCLSIARTDTTKC